MRSFMIATLAFCGCFLASGDVQAQTPTAKFQAYMTSGNLALTQNNYPMAITYFKEAVRLFPTNQTAVTLLAQTTQTYNAAVATYTSSLTAGQVALGKGDFTTATTAFTAAATAASSVLPANATDTVTAHKFLTGTAAIQAAAAYIANGDFTDAKTSYATAYALVGSNQYAKVPLAAIHLAITQNSNPALYYAQNFNAGVSAMLGGKYPQAQTYFTTAATLAANLGVADQNKAQNYYNAATALQTASTDLSGSTPNYVDAVAQYQTVVTSLTGDANAQAVVTRLKSALLTGLNSQVTKGNTFLNNNDVASALTIVNNVNALVTLFPTSTTAQAFLNRFASANQRTLTAAINNNPPLINVTTFAGTGNSASSINISFQSAAAAIWYLQIPAGTTFTAAGLGVNATASQNMVLLANTSVQVKPNSTTVLPGLSAASLDPTNVTPTAQNQLTWNQAAPPANLLPILQALQAVQATARVSQFAVWIVLNPALQSTDISIGSVGPTAQELATLVTVFTKAGLNPQNYTALQ